MVNAIPRSVYTQERDPLPIVQEDGCAAGPVWMGADNLTLTRILLNVHPLASCYTHYAIPALCMRRSEVYEMP